jgi:thymidylate synthase (FAD)
MSTNGEFVDWDADMKLLKFLWDNKHHTPFEMAGMILEIKAPIFVFREWHRHRTQSYNEMSARYIPLPDDNYIPNAASVVRRAAEVTSNKQAQSHGDATLTYEDMVLWTKALEAGYRNDQAIYELGLRLGVPKEVARIKLPVGRYSKMRVSANLRNWLAFLTLRQAPNAQWEIRQYADAVCSLIQDQFPRTHKLFAD